MPVTRAANAAIDKVAHQHAEVARMLADYGDSDLLCYRAESPADLAARQAEAWDPLLDWAESDLSARLETRTGVMPQPQDPETLDRLHREVEMLDFWALTAFHDLVGISGSLIIGFAALRDAYPAQTLWQVSRVDEVWQQEQWGSDEDAERVARAKKRIFSTPNAFTICRAPDRGTVTRVATQGAGGVRGTGFLNKDLTFHAESTQTCRY